MTVLSDQMKDGEPKEYKYALDSSALLVRKTNCKAGDLKGSILQLLRVSSAEAVQKYIVEEVQKSIPLTRGRNR